jgi:hypothetical protein
LKSVMQWGAEKFANPNEAQLFVPQMEEDAASLIDQIEWLARTSNEAKLER